MGAATFADQLTRASTSIVLNIAEGSGKFSRPDDACQHEAGKAILERIVSMLIKLAKRLDVD